MSAPESLTSRKDPSQCDRILMALRKGDVDQSMFDRPTCDGHGHIPQIARRIRDLRLRGCVIETLDDGDGYASYRLISEPDDLAGVTGNPGRMGVTVSPDPERHEAVEKPSCAPTLFDLPAETGHYREAA